MQRLRNMLKIKTLADVIQNYSSTLGRITEKINGNTDLSNLGVCGPSMEYIMVSWQVLKYILTTYLNRPY
jgi:hypothetical protein